MNQVNEPQLASVSPEDTEIAAKVDFGAVEGKLNPRQHGSNSSQTLAHQGILNFREEMKAMHFHATRTHDWALWNYGQRMVDTHFVFPLMKLDPADPENYCFKPTDDMIAIARECGMRIFYRMGTSIEHTAALYPGKHYNTIIPDDFEKYAEVLAGIIRHYREGWADGFHFKDMEYWEIWNEPDIGEKMWCGTKEQFIEFFVTVLKRLKKEFPGIKVGGPALTCLNREYFKDLLAACRKAGTAPDFISWHCYTDNAKNLIQQPVDARALLDEEGFKETELCINEWHYVLTWSGIMPWSSPDMRNMVLGGKTGLDGIDGAAFNLAVLSGWQKGPLDTGFYYGSGIDGTWGFRRETDWKLNKSFYSMKMFGRIMAGYADRVKSEDLFSTIYTLGALSADGKKGCLLVDDYRGERSTLEIAVKGLENARNIRAVILDDKHDLTPVPAEYSGGKLLLSKHEYGSAAFLVTFDL